MQYQLRQGDVLLIRIGDAELKTGKSLMRITVAVGEATGHSHVIEARAAKRSGDIVELPVGGLIRHEEHGTIEIPAGRWEIRRQMEWVAFEARQVSD